MMRHVSRSAGVHIDFAGEPLGGVGRRQRRYAIMAAIFIASFTSAALLHHDTALAC